MASILKNSAFIHIPRTGSTFVRVALRECNIPHKNSGDPKDYGVKTIHHKISHAWEEIKDKPYIFSFVRNPVTYLQSMWVKRPTFWIRMAPYTLDCPTFEDFVIEYVSKRSNCITRHFESFLKLPEGYKGKLKIGTLENITDDLLHFLNLSEERYDAHIIRRMQPQHIGARKFPEEVLYPNKESLKILFKLEEAFSKYGYSTEVSQYEQFIKG